jgi:hydrogenase maturation factor
VSVQPATCASDGANHCITCGDDGVPMRVLRVDADRALALCEAGDGARSTVEIALVAADAGDVLLVHAGTALATLPADGLEAPALAAEPVHAATTTRSAQA